MYIKANPEDIIESISSEKEAKDIILAIDLKMASVNFTVDLINTLIQDLKHDPEFNVDSIVR